MTRRIFFAGLLTPALMKSAGQERDEPRICPVCNQPKLYLKGLLAVGLPNGDNAHSHIHIEDADVIRVCQNCGTYNGKP